MFDRRGFLKFAGGAAAGVLATPVVWQTLDDVSIWTQNWPWIPSPKKGNNLNEYIRTTSKLCPSATGLKVRLVDGRPIRALGDADHPLSLGGLSALAAAEVQLLHSPERLRTPLKRSSDGAYVAISWDEAEALLVAELQRTRNKGFVCLSGDENGSMNELLSALTVAMGSNKFFLMPGEAQVTAKAWKVMGGQGRVGFDFAKSDYVLALGANVLEAWGPVVANRRTWGDARPQDAAQTMHLAYAGAVQNNTAAGADTWLPIKPGTELFLALGLANRLFAVKGNTMLGLRPFSELVAKWTPEKVAEVTGLPTAQQEALLTALQNAKAPLIITGSDPTETQGTALSMIGIALNVLLDRVNKDGGLRILPVVDPVVSGAMSYATMMDQNFMGFCRGLSQSKDAFDGGLLLLYEANPVYALSGGNEVSTLLKRAGFSVAFSCFLDESARQCDLVLPAAMGLERFDDVAYPYGVGQNVYALSKPVVKPFYEARAAGDVLLASAKAAGITLNITTTLELFEQKAKATGAEWNTLLKGECFVDDRVLSLQTLRLPVDIVKQQLTEPSVGGLSVAVVSKRSLGTAETAIPPFNTKTITDNELVNGLLVAQMNAATAQKQGLRDGERVVVSNTVGSLEAYVGVYEGVTDDTVALTKGFGHTAFEAFNHDKGANVMRLFSVVIEPGTGLALWHCPGVKIVKA